jgi:hypothetical protein
MKRSIFKLSPALALLALTPAAPATVHAQTETPPPVATTASTSGSGAGLGVGAAAFLGGLPGLVDVVYDVRRFHIEGLLGIGSFDNGANRTNTAVEVGARGWYHLHVGTNSDFSLGGGVGVRTWSGGPGPSVTAVLIEPGMQARAFLTPNFTLNLTAGLTLVLGDNVPNGASKGFGLGSQLLGGVGFTYFFR